MAEKQLTVTTIRMAELLEFSRPFLARIEGAGFVKRAGPNKWNVVTTFQGVLRYMRDEGRRTTKSAVESRVREARAREIELRTARAAGELCRTEEAIGTVDDIIGGLRSDLSGLAAMVTRDLDLRAKIDEALDGILNRASARLDLHAASLRESGQAARSTATLNA